MPGLRWLLLAAGALALVAIYLLGRSREDPWWVRQRDRLRRHFVRRRPAPRRREPDLGAAPAGEPAPPPEELDTLNRLVQQERRPDYLSAGGSPDKIVSLHIRARRGIIFRGPAIAAAATGAGMRHGAMNIYHYPDPASGTLFSMTDMYEPGEFDPDSLDGFETTGLTFFLALPASRSAPEALDPMIEAARSIADRLHGELLDDSRSTLSRQRVETLREELREYERQRRLREKL